MAQNCNKIPIREGLFTIPGSPKENPQLTASKCASCGEIFFPTRTICQNCHDKHLQEIKLSRRGKIYSFTIVTQRPASHYRGPVPYAFGWVQLQEGIRVETLFTGCDLEDLRINMDMELIIEKLYDNDEGNEVICHKFRPVK